MAVVEWAETAVSALAELVLTHRLPADTRDRVRKSVQPLARFPRLGPEIETLRDGDELRFLIGPWPWMVIVYVYVEREQRAVIVSVEDGRAATTTVARRRRS